MLKQGSSDYTNYLKYTERKICLFKLDKYSENG